MLDAKSREILYLTHYGRKNPYLIYIIYIGKLKNTTKIIRLHLLKINYLIW